MPLILAPLLAGCLQFETQNTISWSPSGSELAFLSRGQAWVYDLASGRMSRLEARAASAALAWSPDGRHIALSSGTAVELFARAGSSFLSSATFRAATDESPILHVLDWHPDGRRLLRAGVGEKGSETYEIDVASASSNRLGSGVGIYGPKAHWLLWTAQAALGLRQDLLVFDRQTAAGVSLLLSESDRRLLEGGVFDLLLGAGESSEGELCLSRSDVEGHKPESKVTEIYCLSEAGALELRARLPVAGSVFPDRAAKLFAVIEDPGDHEKLRLSVFDAKGRRRVEGRRILDRLLSQAAMPKAQRVSRLAWSPDGNWLAWIVEGRLCLWNWRNDEVRVHEPS